MYMTNNGIFLDSWNKTIKLLEILVVDSCPECLQKSFLHDIVRISYNQEPKMKVDLIQNVVFDIKLTREGSEVFKQFRLHLLVISRPR
jgi:hypothetical protein